MLSRLIKSVNIVEKFFISSLAVSFFSALNPLVSLFFSALIPLFFFKGRWRVFFVAVFLLLSFMYENSAFLTKNADNSYNLKYKKFTTPISFIEIPKDLEASTGELVFGKITKIPYEAEANPAFSAGFYRMDKKWFSFEIPFISGISNFRESFSEELYALSGGEITITQALLLGDKSYLDNALKDTYIVTGLAHLLAVSGLHTGVVAAIILSLFFFLPFKFRLGASLFVITLFVPLAGFKITVIRAYLVVLAWMGAFIYDHGIRFRNVLFFMAGSFLLVMPDSVGSPSFLLSFSAVYGISCLKYEPDKIFSGVIKAGVMASTFTLPFSLYFFGTANPASVITTLVMLPITYIHLFSGAISLIFTQVSIQPLIYIEKAEKFLTSFFYEHTFSLFNLHTIELSLCIGAFIFLYIIAKTKYYWLCVIIFIIPYLPSSHPDGIYFINGTRDRGFIIKQNESEIFYHGGRSGFVYNLVKLAGKLNLKEFEKGNVSIFGGENIFLKINNKSQNFSGICVNEQNESCEYVFFTSLKEQKKIKFDDKKFYIAYKFTDKPKRFIELMGRKTVFLKDGKFKELN